MYCLLDKATARFAVQGLLKLGEDQALSDQEVLSLDLVLRASRSSSHLLVVPPTANVLGRLAQSSRYDRVVNLFLARVEVARPTLYFKRWSRRLRDLGFTREDTAVLALATFGTDKESAVLGMEVVATCDQPLINNWLARQQEIQGRLTSMQQNLRLPYSQARLPQVLRPEQINFA